MQKLMRMIHKEEKGFTLVELMVVVVIIGILVAIAIPLYGTVTTNAANRSHEANIRTLIGAANMALVEGNPDAEVTWNSTTPAEGADYDWRDFLDDWYDVPPAADLAAGNASVPVTGDADPDTDQTYEVTISTGGEVSVSVVNSGA